MAITPYLSAVNQKLLYARQLCKLGEHAGGVHAAAAMAQAITVQLKLAMDWHLCDIAATYQLADPGAASDPQALIDQLAGEGKQAVEAVELDNLKSEADSWYAQLSVAAKAVNQLPRPRVAHMDSDRLPVVAMDGGQTEVAWSLTECGQWLTCATELIERQREMMVEF